MREALSSSFERLLGHKASDEQVRRLYEVKDALKLGDNDALWTVVLALEHYDSLYREYPARLAVTYDIDVGHTVDEEPKPSQRGGARQPRP